jgi:hypothetical protein
MQNVDRPISSVLNDIVGNVQHIVRSEFRLARTEVTQEAGKALSAGVFVALGAAMLFLAGLFALLAVVYALSLVMPAWGAALVVAAGEALMAAVFIGIGIKRFKATRAPPRTIETMKENVEWAKQLTR